MGCFNGFVLACYLRSCVGCMQVLRMGVFVEDCHGNMGCVLDRKMDCFGSEEGGITDGRICP